MDFAKQHCTFDIAIKTAHRVAQVCNTKRGQLLSIDSLNQNRYDLRTVKVL